jgi:hypothetical protein
MTKEQTPQPQIYICHHGHEYDRIFTENLFQYLNSKNILCHELKLNLPTGQRDLYECLTNPDTVVMGYNSQLDHSHLGKEGFVAAAAERGIPVIQWILDHPASRWSEFESPVPANSCYLLNTDYEQAYFQRFCAPGTVTGVMGGVGPHKLSRVDQISLDRFKQRPIKCLIALGFKRLGRVHADTLKSIASLDETTSDVVKAAILSARFDLDRPFEAHLLKAADQGNVFLNYKKFNFCFNLVEEAVQAIRRMMIFNIARSFPVFIQSDGNASALVQGEKAKFLTGVSMQTTLARIPLCRSVLSVSPLNDMIHDRTMNSLQAGCVPLIEDNLVHRAVFEHGQNALMFRYDDDSLEKCLEIVCNQPERAWEIAQRAFAMRDNPIFSFGRFHNIMDVAERQREFLRSGHAPALLSSEIEPTYRASLDVSREISPRSTANASRAELTHFSPHFGSAVLMILYGAEKETEMFVYEISLLLDTQEKILILKIDDSQFDLSFLDKNIEYPLLKGKNKEDLYKILNNFKILRINIHYQFGCHKEIREILLRTNAPYDLTIYNFVLACPRVHMFRKGLGYCGEPEILGCLECLRDEPEALAKDILWWRWLGQELVEGAQHVICPSVDAAERVKKYFPRAKFLVIPPENPQLFEDRRLHVPALSGLEPMRVAIFEVGDAPKGTHYLDDCIDAWREAGLNIDITIIGESTISSLQRRICVTGPYEASQLPWLIAAIDPHLIFYQQQWVEAYSHTLSAGLRAGMPLLVPDIGAFRERIAGKQWCWLYDPAARPPSLSRLLQQIRKAHIEPAIAPEPVSHSRPTMEYICPSEFYKSDYLRPQRS